MGTRVLLLSILFFFFFQTRAQVTTEPVFPVASQSVTITFDSSKENRLGKFTGDLYAHTGVKIEGNPDWQHVIGTWGNNTTQPKLTNRGDGIYELTITPDINSFYGVPANEKILELAFVFRSADGSKQTNDLFTGVFEEGLFVNLTSPAEYAILKKNEVIPVSAISSIEGTISLYINDTPLAETTGKEITTNYLPTESGRNWLIAKITAGDATAYDSVSVYIKEDVTLQAKPAGYKKGINYPDDHSAGFVLWAPEKEFVYVIGDFNDWQVDEAYQMKKDGDYFWLTVADLTPRQEYIFQYFIDGEIRIGDPYCDKISDPYDDHYISSTVYPNLISYPAGKTEGRASVLQTGQVAYQWQTNAYPIPPKENLHIYELLIRDFTEEKTYTSIRENLDYFDSLGVNTLGFMPFSEFEGNSSWGYNPNYYFAPDKAYGTKDDLKELIDSCHRRGFLVIQDLVLNHAYNSSPMAQLYWDATNNRPAANNPWFNASSPNPVFYWGSDFNHESTHTQAFVDSVTSYWLTEYKVDGFRFDFTKGFTNTPGDGSAYDASRIAILKRMADHIWSVNPEAVIILEHFADNSEEKILTSYQNGMLVWGNANYNFNEATMGYHDGGKSDFSWASWQKRGFTQPGLVAYMESHDEERLMYKNLTYGNASGTYNIKNTATSLKRNALAATFFFCLTGPKMIWQFGEFGYDVSIDYNDRVGEKPLKWEYLDDPDHQELFKIYSAMMALRKQFPVFTSGTETLNLAGEMKSIQLNLENHHISLIGNFGLSQKTISAPFKHTGTWHEFFTGQSVEIASTSVSIPLDAGEYRLYSDQKLPAFKTPEPEEPEEPEEITDLFIYPNPVGRLLHIRSPHEMKQISIYTLDGKLLMQIQTNRDELSLDVASFNSGLYFIQVFSDEGIETRKFVKSHAD